MAREQGTPASLNELMGNKTEDLELSDLAKVLGDKMPEIPMNQVGRLRLIKALRNRFGDGFRNIPGVRHLIKEFDEELKVATIVRMNKRG